METPATPRDNTQAPDEKENRKDTVDQRIDFVVPEGMNGEDVARCFNAYLLGPIVFDNRRQGRGPDRYVWSMGPYKNVFGAGNSWQLDPTNDFWLHFTEDGTTFVTCRYPADAEKLLVMVKLFKLSFPPRRSQQKDQAPPRREE